MTVGRRRLLTTGVTALGLGVLNPRRSWAADAEVATTLGRLRGADQGDYRVFRGIPYAQPPIGPLRFRAPVPALPWTGVRDAVAFGPAPMQPVRSLPLYPRPLLAGSIDEDCLYLNVWAPASEGPHPVMVWVYGGSNIIGATSQKQYDGASFARDGVVCVTIGYRVGAFGFTELGSVLGAEYSGSGNNALRDLVLGLRWVRDNIASFGGDPERVTLAGESAGGKNVCSLLAAPMADGLFRSAIVESGGGQTVHTMAAAQDVAARFVGAVGLAEGDAGALLTRPARELLDGELKMLAAYPRGFAYRGVVDGAVLPQIPLQAVSEWAARDVALLIGTNRDESVLFQPPDPAHAPIGSRELAQLDVAAMQEMEAKYRARFPQMPDADRRGRMVTAEEYWIPCVRVAEAHAAAGGRTFMYRFDRAPRSGPYQGRAVHTSELPFVWDNFTDEAMRPAGMGAAEQDLATTMHAAWVQFIMTGTPAAQGMPEWTPYAPERRSTMVFDERGVLLDDPSGDERVLWAGVL